MEEVIPSPASTKYSKSTFVSWFNLGPHPHIFNWRCSDASKSTETQSPSTLLRRMQPTQRLGFAPLQYNQITKRCHLDRSVRLSRERLQTRKTTFNTEIDKILLLFDKDFIHYSIQSRACNVVALLRWQIYPLDLCRSEQTTIVLGKQHKSNTRPLWNVPLLMELRNFFYRVSVLTSRIGSALSWRMEDLIELYF